MSLQNTAPSSARFPGLLAITLIGLAGSAAQAQYAVNNTFGPPWTTVDQFTRSSVSGEAAGQTFVPTIGGTLYQIQVTLSTFDFSRNNPITVRFFDASGGLATLASNQLGQLTFPAVFFNPPALVTFDMSSLGINLNAGQLYAFSLSATPNSNNENPGYFAYGSSPNNPTYSGGEAIHSFNGSTYLALQGYDLSFAVTVPGPSAAALLGLGGLLASRRRRA